MKSRYEFYNLHVESVFKIETDKKIIHDLSCILWIGHRTRHPECNCTTRTYPKFLYEKYVLEQNPKMGRIKK